MSLQPQTVDVPLLTLDQKSPTTSGPVGRLQALVNAVCDKYQAGAGYRVQKRPGYAALSRARFDAVGVPEASPFADPQLVAALDDQLVAVAAQRALVRQDAAANGGWVDPGQAVHPQTLSQRVAYVRNSVLAVPDAAVLGTSVCTSVYDAAAGGIVVKISDTNGTELRAPQLVSLGKRAKVAHDGALFWVFAENGAGGLAPIVYTPQGQHVATGAAIPFDFTWDITPYLVAPPANGVALICSVGFVVQYNLLTIGPGPSVVLQSWTDAAVGPQAAMTWLANPTGDGKLYYATERGAGPYTIQAFCVTPVAPWTSTLSTVTTTVALPVAGISGIVPASTGGPATLIVSSMDAANDLKNLATVVSLPWTAGAPSSTPINGVSAVSRAFQLGGRNVVILYRGVGTVDGSFSDDFIATAWFLYDLDAHQVAGQWEFTVAYADWLRLPGAAGQWQPSTVSADSAGNLIVALAYRAQSVTEAKREPGDVAPYFAVAASTIGVKHFTISPTVGRPAQYASELFLPGMGCMEFTGKEVMEAGIPLPPAILSHSTAGGGTLQANVTYQYVAVYEYTDGNGNVHRSPQSNPVNVAMGANTKVTLVGTTLAVTRKVGIRVSITRTVYVQGVMSTVHHKATDDLNPLYNDPTALTWSFTDNIADSAAVFAETLYADAGFIDRYGGPAFSCGAQWQNRVWLAAYDGSVWFSGEKTEGDGLWFNPAFRIALPSGDAVTALVNMESFLLIFTRNGAWYIERGALPSATLSDGTIPTPVKLPFTDGCVGHAATTRDGCVYESSAGGVWLLTRALQNIYLSAAIEDDLRGRTVLGIAADRNHRVAVVDSSGTVGVWDSVAQAWYRWTFAEPLTGIASWRGDFALATALHVWTPGAAAYDTDAETVTNYAVVTTVATTFIHLAGVRKYQRLWRVQAWGVYKGAHTLTVTIAYDDGNPAIPATTRAFAADPTAPYLFEIVPRQQLCSSVAFTFADSFPSGPSAGFALELLSFEIGIETGLARLPVARRIPQ